MGVVKLYGKTSRYSFFLFASHKRKLPNNKFEVVAQNRKQFERILNSFALYFIVRDDNFFFFAIALIRCLVFLRLFFSTSDFSFAAKMLMNLHHRCRPRNEIWIRMLPVVLPHRQFLFHRRCHWKGWVWGRTIHLLRLSIRVPASRGWILTILRANNVMNPLILKKNENMSRGSVD